MFEKPILQNLDQSDQFDISFLLQITIFLIFRNFKIF